MKFIRNNKTWIILIIFTIFNLFNVIELSGTSQNNNNKGFPRVGPLDPDRQLAVEEGNKFCETNCKIFRKAKRIKVCLFENEQHKCMKCKQNPKFKADEYKNRICKNYCNAILPSGACKFYGYFTGKLKENEKQLLEKYKLKLVK